LVISTYVNFMMSGQTTVLTIEMEMTEATNWQRRQPTVEKPLYKLINGRIHINSAALIDGSDHQFIIKQDDEVRVYRWSEMHYAKEYPEVKAIKNKLLPILGKILRYVEFPNGKKTIVYTQSPNSRDTVVFDIFPNYQFYYKSYSIIYDNKHLSLNGDGFARIKLHKKDTVNIRDRIQIEVELLDSRKITI